MEPNNNKLKCPSVLSTPNERNDGRGKWWVQWGNVWTKCTASLEDANKFFSFFQFFQMCFGVSSSSTRCCHCSCRRRFVWNVADKPLGSVFVVVVCVVWCCLPADVFHKKSKWQVFPAPRRCQPLYTHSCRNYAA